MLFHTQNLRPGGDLAIPNTGKDGGNIGKITLESNSPTSRKVEDAYIQKYFLTCISQMC